MIVFDLDDTLYKERDYVLSGLTAVARLAARNPEQVRPLLAAMIAEESDPIGLAARLTDRDLDTLVHFYRTHFPSISLSPMVRLPLQCLPSMGHNLAIITDGRAVTQRNKYEALGLERYVPSERLFISEEIGAEKTEPLAFEKMMEAYPEEKQWVYVGDNPAKDFIHPNRLGWSTYMLLDSEGVNIHPQVIPDIPDAAPQHTIPFLRELLHRVGSKN